MNLQHYSALYSTFHGAHTSRVVGDSIVIPLHSESSIKNIVLKVQDHQLVLARPTRLTTALAHHFKVEGPCTVFTHWDSWSVLLGDHTLVFPRHGGATLFCATHFFVKEPEVFLHYMKSVDALHFRDHVVSHDHAVLFLDPCDVPFPGGRYHDASNTATEWYRVCALAHHTATVERLERELQNRKGFWALPAKVRSVESRISPFLDLKPVRNFSLPERRYKETNIIQKKKSLQRADFIVQDILDTFRVFNDVGLLIEAPLRVAYSTFDPDTRDAEGRRQFYALSVNCNVPNRVLYVPAPYDRYFHYDMPTHDIAWTPVVYDHERTPAGLESVVVDGNTIGYVYRDSFFCLNAPKLPVHTHARDRNLNGLLRKLAFDIKDDPQLKIVNTIRYDPQHLLYCVKHSALRHQLWCLADYDSRLSYPRKYVPPYLVREWAETVVGHAYRCADYGDLGLVRLMYVLARHKICFSIREAAERRLDFENLHDVVFHAEADVVHFLNSLRLGLGATSSKEAEKNLCRVM